MNVGDGDVVKITGISETAFKGNTFIKEVRLSDFITEIPDNAFEGCVSLYGISGGSITKIGSKAFKGCTNMETIIVDNYIKFIGDTAFDGCGRLLVNAANVDVAEATVNSGAKYIQLYANAKTIENGENAFVGKTLKVPAGTELFAFCGYGYLYPGLAIESSANETVINKASFENYDVIPMKASSSSIVLNQVSMKSSDFGIVATNENTNLLMQADIKVTSKSEKSVLCQNISFGDSNENVEGNLIVSGNIYMNGSADGVNHLAKNGDEIIYINSEKYNNLVNPYILTFDANGGTVNSSSKVVYKGEAYSSFPTPEREHYSFDGWYTSAEGGTEISDNSVCDVTKDTTLHAHWTLNAFDITFDASGGKVDTSSKTVVYGDKYGELPTPTRDYYTFLGWFTELEDNEGNEITSETVLDTAENITLYAHWKHNDPSGWIKASEMPSGAQVVDTKWSYTLREYTTNSASSLSGWTKYDTKRTSWGATQGPVYSDPSNGSRNVWPESYVTSSNYKTVYHYYRYSVNYSGGYGSYAQSSSYPNYYEYNFDSPLEYYGDVYGHAGYKWWYNGTNYVTLYQRSPFTTQEWVSDNYGTRWYYQEPVYTYYYHRDLSKEATSDPTGQSNVSNVVKWVQYRVK